MALPSAEQQEAFCTEHLNCAICACQCGPAMHVPIMSMQESMFSRVMLLDTELMALPSAEQQEAFCSEHLNCAICACQCGPAVHMYPFRGVVANCGCIV